MHSVNGNGPKDGFGRLESIVNRLVDAVQVLSLKTDFIEKALGDMQMISRKNVAGKNTSEFWGKTILELALAAVQIALMLGLIGDGQADTLTEFVPAILASALETAYGVQRLILKLNMEPTPPAEPVG